MVYPSQGQTHQLWAEARAGPQLGVTAQLDAGSQAWLGGK